MALINQSMVISCPCLYGNVDKQYGNTDDREQTAEQWALGFVWAFL
jgi:hypothetical protein